jgi:hypothetical protein
VVVPPRIAFQGESGRIEFSQKPLHPQISRWRARVARIGGTSGIAEPTGLRPDDGRKGRGEGNQKRTCSLSIPSFLSNLKKE